MPAISFCKFHGFGNDYIVFETSDVNSVSDLSDLARRLCERHAGVGGDGIAVLRRLENASADYECRIVNPDGSHAGFSGNGTRCAAAYLYYKNLWSADDLRLSTESGVKNYQFLRREANAFWFRAALGKPRFDLPGAPPTAIHPETGARLEPAKFSNLLLPGEGIGLQFVFVDVGNPVAAIFVENFDALDWRFIGRTIESHFQIFPNRTNVVFVKPLDRANVEIRIWERGAGETASSGTCSIAAAVASAHTEKTGRKVSVHAPGGTTEAFWRETDDEMLITGRADLAFCGEWFD